jgi:microcystin-dependent protein
MTVVAVSPQSKEAFDTIPDAEANLNSLLASVRAMKGVIEQLTGTKGNLAPTRTFVADTPPPVIVDGDRWTKPSYGPGGAPSIEHVAKNGVWVAAASSQGWSPGDLKHFAGVDAGPGWYPCDGRQVNREMDAALFAAIGTIWGVGDGSTSFNLPDFRGRVLASTDQYVVGGVAGADAARLNLATRVVGGVGGTGTHTLSLAEMPTHNHTIVAGDTTPASFTSRAGEGDGNNVYNIGTSNAGSSAAHNNMQPTGVVSIWIKR